MIYYESQHTSKEDSDEPAHSQNLKWVFFAQKGKALKYD